MDSNWKGIKEAITSKCYEVLGHKKHHKEWITVDTLDKIQERKNKKAAINTSRTRAEKAKAQTEYTKVNKQVERSNRTDKRKYVEDLAMMTEKAAREGNIIQLYDTTKKLAGNYRKPERPVKTKEGKVITNIEGQRWKWIGHTLRQHPSASQGMKSSRPKEKRKTKEHITPRNGDRHEKNERKLLRTGKEGPGQSALEYAGRRPMLHCE
ncbi:unnamed protein product [Schistosoma curassoni]|uniref:Reverse transcriptase domain-containing protein n=1 Tax=Schistosoma curassoni TaxID=6186 RepID=A0A183JE74_9TREM|nr:unnamed protein product [Schistosoma curassoni]